MQYNFPPVYNQCKTLINDLEAEKQIAFVPTYRRVHPSGETCLGSRFSSCQETLSLGLIRGPIFSPSWRYPGLLFFLFSLYVLSDTLWHPGLQNSRLLCLPLSPSICLNSCPSSQWCHPTISSSVIPFSSCFQSFLSSGSFSMSQLFASGGQSIGASASALVLPMNIQGWLPWGLTGLVF